jgi:hypothetical protein
VQPRVKIETFRAVERKSTNKIHSIDKKTLFVSDIVMSKFKKLNFIVGPAQFGKTGITIQYINRMIEREKETGKESLHFVFTQNTFLNQNQFLNRLTKSIKPECLMSLGSKITNIKRHAKKASDILFEIVRDKSVKVVVVCSNYVRYRDIQDLVVSLEKFSNAKSIFVYFDEVHKIFDSIQSFLCGFENIASVVQIVGLTATPMRIISRGELMDLSGFALPPMESYYSFEKDHLHVEPFIKYTTSMEYAVSVLEKYPESFFTNGCRTFIPSQFATECHLMLKTRILQMCPQAVIFVLNGTIKCLYFMDEGDGAEVKEEKLEQDKCMQCKDHVELSEKIPHFLEKYSLQQRPLFITGFVCVSVGITLCSEKLGPFTSSIISHVNLQKDEKFEDIYQLAARTAGNMKKWSTYKRGSRTVVYCPCDIYEIIKNSEKYAHDTYKIATKMCPAPEDAHAPNLDMKESIVRKRSRGDYDNNNNDNHTVPVMQCERSPKRSVCRAVPWMQVRVARTLINYKIFWTEGEAERFVQIVEKVIIDRQQKHDSYKKDETETVSFLQAYQESPEGFVFNRTEAAEGKQVPDTSSYVCLKTIAGLSKVMGNTGIPETKSVSNILSRKWGLTKERPVRKMYSTSDKVWVVYWKDE